MLRSVGAGLLVVFIGCGGTGDPPPPADVGPHAPRMDIGSDADASADSGWDAEVQACGDATCGEGERCCSTCPGEPDVCVPVAFDCPVADEFDCMISVCPAETDVTGASVGDCESVLGYHWEGIRCVPLTGCSCVGDVCAELFASMEECEGAHGECRLCGTVLEVPCEATEFCRYTGPIDRCTFLPDLWGICVPMPDSCDAELSPVCACDGTTYDNPCLARAARQTVDYLGPCRTGA